MKDIVTAWQIRDAEAGVVNDHTDADYDRAVLDRLGAAPRRRGRLAHPARGRAARDSRTIASGSADAVERAQAGDGRYVASPRVDSYHGIWFELHEDLIRLAGRTRAAEVAAGRA